MIAGWLSDSCILQACVSRATMLQCCSSVRVLYVCVVLPQALCDNLLAC